jgi:hypothetical protein
MEPLGELELREGERPLRWQGDGGDTGDLMVGYDALAGRSRSVWTLSHDERMAILDGARVELTVYGNHPPVHLAVEGAAEPQT